MSVRRPALPHSPLWLCVLLALQGNLAAAESLPTEVDAHTLSGTQGEFVQAEGDAILRQGPMSLRADRLTYLQALDEVRAEGAVIFRHGADRMEGTGAWMRLGERVGEFEAPRYSFSRIRAADADDAAREVTGSGQAERLLLEGPNHYRLLQATWSTCRAEDPDWYLKASEIELDYHKQSGEAWHSQLVFQGVPLLYLPWVRFPLVNQRQSGFLTPVLASSNKTGLDLALPYYWNIAPNLDATFTPRLMGRRGLQLGSEFRYLMPRFTGVTRLEWLPRDAVRGGDRAALALVHHHALSSRLSANVDFNAVSDTTYFEDLSSRLASSSQSSLVRQANFHYAGSDWWQATALLQSHQTLSGVQPYRRLPQLVIDARRPYVAGGLSLGLRAEAVDFSHPNPGRDRGQRLSLEPELAWPLVGAGYHLTPRIAGHLSRYALDRRESSGPGDVSRALPIFTVDGGLVFERPLLLAGRDWIQTLEPRLYYAHVPYRDQSDIPNFDSGLLDFNFTQLFQPNLFSGGDRIANANQITAALSSRLIDPTYGGELMRATLGQRYYLSDQRVTLPGVPTRTGRRADLLAAFSGTVAPATRLDAGWQYNPRDKKSERVELAVHYQPGFARTLSISYREVRDTLRDIDLAAQWPLGAGWYGVARYTRSLRDRRVTEAITGLEYNGGCWVLRTAVHRFATGPRESTSAFFVQLELNDLGSLGSSPVHLLRRSVPGYGNINRLSADPIFSPD